MAYLGWAIRRGVSRKGAKFVLARIRGKIASRVDGIEIVFPVVAGAATAFGRMLEAPNKEPATQRWIAEIAAESAGATFWDVGANIGLFSLLAAQRGLKVVAFEPHVGSQRLLQLAVAQNDRDGSIMVVPFGLTDHTGADIMSVKDPSAGITGSSLGAPVTNSHHRFTTFVMRGDDVRTLLPAPFNKPTAIKVDVDGIEPKILEGLQGLLLDGCLQHLMVETSATDHGLNAMLTPFGFVQTHEERTNLVSPGRNVNRYFRRVG